MPPSTEGLPFTSPDSSWYGPGGYYGPGGQNNPYKGGRNGGFGPAEAALSALMSQRQKVLIAHAILASLAFVIFFPLGSILIRLGSFRGLWLVHGLFQIFAYIVYTVGFGIGIWLVNHMPISLNNYHSIIGIIVFCLLFFQPILGLVHHFQFKKSQHRTVWSHGHLWLGRVAITVGIINGGLGMLLAVENGIFEPSTGQMIAYGVVSGVMWLAWLAATVIGERKRARAAKGNAEAQRRASISKEQYA